MIYWPIRNGAKKWKRGQLGAARPARGAPERHHMGTDIGARADDILVATEPGKLAHYQGWSGPTSKALLLHTDTGKTVLYGNVAPGSHVERGLKIGDRVAGGQAIARPGAYPKGSHMLHMELYDGHVARNKRWAWGAPQPAGVTSADTYLEAATVATGRQGQPAPGSGLALGVALVILVWWVGRKR